MLDDLNCASAFLNQAVFFCGQNSAKGILSVCVDESIGTGAADECTVGVGGGDGRSGVALAAARRSAWLGIFMSLCVHKNVCGVTRFGNCE